MTAENQTPEVETNSTDEKKATKLKPYGVNIYICVMIDEMPHEIATAQLRSEKPFKKEHIEAFIEKDDFISIIRKGIEEENQEIKTFYTIINDCK